MLEDVGHPPNTEMTDLEWDLVTNSSQPFETPSWNTGHLHHLQLFLPRLHLPNGHLPGSKGQGQVSPIPRVIDAVDAAWLAAQGELPGVPEQGKSKVGWSTLLTIAKHYEASLTIIIKHHYVSNCDHQ